MAAVIEQQVQMLSVNYQKRKPKEKIWLGSSVA